ncbi:MAG: transcription-repair coupling factor, partial [Candidatus Azotimanducaceae bacterium]
LYLDSQELESNIANFSVIKINEIDTNNASSQKSHPIPSLRSETKPELNETEVINFVSKVSQPILFSCSSEGRREMLDSKLLKLGIKTSIVSEFQDYLASNNHCITVSQITEGIWNDKIIVLTENELYGTKPTVSKSFANKVIDPEQIIQNLNELSIGAPVVHLEHGIGRYMGLELLEIEGVENEYLTLTYAGSAKLYVPVASLHLISRYAGADEEHAPLHRLGSSQWTKAKRKASEKIVDVAAELLQAYATREAKRSASLAVDAEDLARFNDEFSFELTQDQESAIEAVLNDLQSERAMDRLVCGDVGFGKTEVAMRAALVAVKSGKQVVILVPTTLLAQQHYDTLKDRFAQWPFIIELVSRLRHKSEIEAVALGCSSGKVDIVVGTHKLFGEDFKFKDLGLVVIDEEHRFGVRQKELIRAFRAQADVLTLTATPIPRTLNMSLGGIRDLSIIATPPAKRLSIKTFVQEKRSDLIKEAINRELMRGGQVFFVHNEVKTIELIAQTLSEQLTEARIGIGHGQMPKKQLEQVMGDFYQRKINVLICTTIIENGIDIPNANTIIIDRADKFGLAQLHQLRGRVGRSNRQAYAYLLTPEPDAITPDATKRLEAIEAAGELGIGFTLATQDMEIRGAGQLLGEEQSGQMESIGFSLYMQMLNKAVEDINQGKIPELDNPLNEVAKEINLHCSAIIPETYLPDVHHRLMFYKRLANAKTKNEIDALQVEMIDRFGLLPEALKRLFVISALKLLCESHGLQTVEIGQERGKLVFADTTTIEPLSIVKLVQEDSNTYQFEGSSTLITAHQLDSFEDRVQFLEELINKLSNSSSEAANA